MNNICFSMKFNLHKLLTPIIDSLSSYFYVYLSESILFLSGSEFDT